MRKRTEEEVAGRDKDRIGNGGRDQREWTELAEWRALLCRWGTGRGAAQAAFAARLNALHPPHRSVAGVTGCGAARSQLYASTVRVKVTSTA